MFCFWFRLESIDAREILSYHPTACADLLFIVCAAKKELTDCLRVSATEQVDAIQQNVIVGGHRKQCCPKGIGMSQNVRGEESFHQSENVIPAPNGAGDVDVVDGFVGGKTERIAGTFFL